MQKEVIKVIPDAIAEAIHETARNFKYHPGSKIGKNGISGLALEISADPGSFSNKCNPKQGGHTPHLLDILNIMTMTGSHEILNQLARQFNYVCVPIEDYKGVSDMELLNAWAAWGAERGETEQAIHHALEDSSITRTEYDKIKNEMFEDFQKELALLARIEGLVE